jgi:hypothetical protein
MNTTYTEFIGQGQISSSLCESLIDLFKSSLYKNPTVAKDHDGDWLEVQFNPWDSLMTGYVGELQKVLDDYIAKFPYCNMFAPFTTTELFKIQHYTPGKGYTEWHTERGSASEPIVTRHLVFMTYLNTVTDQGGTEFLHQNLVINAEQGKTLIWPADWTHTHRGIASPTQEKFIITGWFNYI